VSCPSSALPLPLFSMTLPGLADLPLPWVQVVLAVAACAFPTSSAKCRVLHRAGTPGKGSPALRPVLHRTVFDAVAPPRARGLIVVFITAVPITKLFAGGGGGGTMEDMCYERLRAEACVD
jgi:hypothetical protein